MPRCYLLAVARGSSLDESSKTWTLFSLVEYVRTDSALPAHPPVELHAFWKFAPDEIDIPFEMRVVLLPAGRRPIPGKVFPFRSPGRRNQIRICGIPPIPAWGEYEITVEWREADGGKWTPSGVAWPIELQQEPPRGVLN